VFQSVRILPCELCSSMVDVRSPKVFTKKLDLGIDKLISIVYNTDILNNSTKENDNEDN